MLPGLHKTVQKNLETYQSCGKFPGHVESFQAMWKVFRPCVKTDLRAFVANCWKRDIRAFSPGKFLSKKSATWKVFVFSAPAPHMIDPIHYCVLLIPFGQIFPCGHMDNYDPMVTVIYLHLWWSCLKKRYTFIKSSEFLVNLCFFILLKEARICWYGEFCLQFSGLQRKVHINMEDRYLGRIWCRIFASIGINSSRAWYPLYTFLEEALQNPSHGIDPFRGVLPTPLGGQKNICCMYIFYI